jgi:hypothetical protein
MYIKDDKLKQVPDKCYHMVTMHGQQIRLVREHGEMRFMKEQLHLFQPHKKLMTEIRILQVTDFCTEFLYKLHRTR